MAGPGRASHPAVDGLGPRPDAADAAGDGRRAGDGRHAAHIRGRADDGRHAAHRGEAASHGRRARRRDVATDSRHAAVAVAEAERGHRGRSLQPRPHRLRHLRRHVLARAQLKRAPGQRRHRRRRTHPRTGPQRPLQDLHRQGPHRRRDPQLGGPHRRRGPHLVRRGGPHDDNRPHGRRGPLQACDVVLQVVRLAVVRLKLALHLLETPPRLRLAVLHEGLQALDEILELPLPHVRDLALALREAELRGEALDAREVGLLPRLVLGLLQLQLRDTLPELLVPLLPHLLVLQPLGLPRPRVDLCDRDLVPGVHGRDERPVPEVCENCPRRLLHLCGGLPLVALIQRHLVPGVDGGDHGPVPEVREERPRRRLRTLVGALLRLLVGLLLPPQALCHRDLVPGVDGDDQRPVPEVLDQRPGRRLQALLGERPVMLVGLLHLRDPLQEPQLCRRRLGSLLLGATILGLPLLRLHEPQELLVAPLQPLDRLLVLLLHCPEVLHVRLQEVDDRLAHVMGRVGNCGGLVDQQQVLEGLRGAQRRGDAKRRVMGRGALLALVVVARGAAIDDLRIGDVLPLAPVARVGVPGRVEARPAPFHEVSAVALEGRLVVDAVDLLLRLLDLVDDAQEIERPAGGRQLHPLPVGGLFGGVDAHHAHGAHPTCNAAVLLAERVVDVQ
mmetsp:Transcript_74705/g.161545  ORF Transcript_74705/g.161545 Transcript_74705/m.161545 type:complete len:672 (-) Transcript_74705:154-2169(-)